jgi:hypothetical protein
MKRCRLIFLVLMISTLSSCGNQRGDDEPEIQDVTLPDLDVSADPDGIVSLPENVPSVFTEVFSSYTKITAPNGKPIHILAQAGWTRVQIKKARNVLTHLLTDFPGSVYGDDKSPVANAMADRKATMVLFNTEEDLNEALRGPLGELTDSSMQDLRANECPAEGTDDYLGHITRDAAFEEIWHLVHDYGIKPTLPDMLAEMRKANDAAEEKGWKGWPEDEPEEHPNEYVGVLIDNYLDLWAVRPDKYEGRVLAPDDIPDGTSHFGRYFANSRAKLKELDPDGYRLVEKFIHPYLTYTPELPEEFEGTFSIALDKALVYTYKSRHLVNVTLTGHNNANITGNAYDNVLTGNDGDNILTGGPGQDYLDGGEGRDTSVFSGAYSDYTITEQGDHIEVVDNEPRRDGMDILIRIEFLQFRDRRIEL